MSYVSLTSAAAGQTWTVGPFADDDAAAAWAASVSVGRAPRSLAAPAEPDDTPATPEADGARPITDFVAQIIAAEEPTT